MIQLYVYIYLGFPVGASGKELAATAEAIECRSEPWVGKIRWKRERPPVAVFLPGESQWTEESGGLQCIACNM